MHEQVTLTGRQVREVFQAINGVGELLKALPAESKHDMTKYAIVSNLAMIQMAVNPMLRGDRN